MELSLNTACTAFGGNRRLAAGPLQEVALAVKVAVTRNPECPVLVFDDVTGRHIDIDTRGSSREVLDRLVSPEVADAAPRGPGRPRLGVVAREVTLLPRHWAWLNAQPGGASVALRKLVEDARKAGAERDQLRAAQEAAYHFMSAMAGDLPGYEEATRALFAKEDERFSACIESWPADVSQYAKQLARSGTAR